MQICYKSKLIEGKKLIQGTDNIPHVHPLGDNGLPHNVTGS
jgi:hypothetical protein